MKWDDLRRRVNALLEKMVNDPATLVLIRQIAAIAMQGLALVAIMGNQHKLKSASYAECLTKVEDLEHRYAAVVDEITANE